MALDHLSGEMKAAGRAMVFALDAMGLEPQGALWLYFHDLRDWRLTIISDLIDVMSRSKIYDHVGRALDEQGPIDGLTIFDVHLASPTEVIPIVLGSAFKVEGIAAVTVTDCKVDGRPVDAFVYRLGQGRTRYDVIKAANRLKRLGRVEA